MVGEGIFRIASIALTVPRSDSITLAPFMGCLNLNLLMDLKRFVFVVNENTFTINAKVIIELFATHAARTDSGASVKRKRLLTKAGSVSAVVMTVVYEL